MAGLLRHIRKSKQDLGPKITDVVSTDDATFGDTGERADVDALLQGLLQESAQSGHTLESPAGDSSGQDDARKVRGSRVVRRHRTTDSNRVRRTMFTEEVKPWWLEGQHAGSPQIDAFLGSVVPVVQQTLGSEEWAESTIQKLLRDLCDKLLADGVLDHRLPRRLQEQAERELAQILVAKGPLQPLFDDILVSDIFVSGHRSIRVLRNGSMLDTPFTFRSTAEYRLFLAALLRPSRQLPGPDRSSIEAQLPDKWKTRLHLVGEQFADNGEPQLHLRIPRLQQAAFFDLLQTKTLPPTLAAWLAEVVAAREANILVVGPPGAGKTVMTSVLLSSASSDERIVTVERFAELAPPTIPLERLVSRGEGEDSIARLIGAAAQRRPHRIVVGDLDPASAGPYLDLMERGFRGTLATISAQSADAGLWRVVDLARGASGCDEAALMRRVSRAVDIVLVLDRVDGVPCILELSEVYQARDGAFALGPIVLFAGVVAGKRQWRIVAEDAYWVERMAQRGFSLSPGPSLKRAPAPKIAE